MARRGHMQFRHRVFRQGKKKTRSAIWRGGVKIGGVPWPRRRTRRSWRWSRPRWRRRPCDWDVRTGGGCYGQRRGSQGVERGTWARSTAVLGKPARRKTARDSKRSAAFPRHGPSAVWDVLLRHTAGDSLRGVLHAHVAQRTFASSTSLLPSCPCGSGSCPLRAYGEPHPHQWPS